MVQMYVYKVGIDPVGHAFVILTDQVAEHFLPILIGAYEAHAIAAEIEHTEFERPLTHDLLSAVIGSLDWQVTKIVVTKLEDRTYYAELTLINDSRVVVVDSRPSDAIALALKTGADIFVAEEVLEQVAYRSEEGADKTEDLEKLRELLRDVKIDPESFKLPRESDEETENTS